MSKTLAVVLALAAFTVCSIPLSAQILPAGNAYAGIAYGQLTDVVNTQSYRGWNASVEDIPFPRLLHLGFVLDGSGFYRTGVTSYNGFIGPRLATNLGRWRPFAQAMAGVRHINSNSTISNPVTIDVGGGVDYRLRFKNFSWRLQGDYMHSRVLSADQNDYRASTGIVWRF